MASLSLDDLPDWDWYDISAHLKCTEVRYGRIRRYARRLVRGRQFQQGRWLTDAPYCRSGSGDRGANGAHRRGDTFDRLFAGVRFDEVDGDLLYVYAKDEEAAAEMEDSFALHISTVATEILKREIGIVLVLPRELAQ